MGKKICVIGGSGFVGTRLIDLLVKDNEVKIFDKQNSDFYPQLVTIGNVLDRDVLVKALQGVDVVVLLAAEHRDDVSPVSLYYDVNVQGARNVLDAMDTNGVKNIIFTSSVAIYGLNKINPDETHPADPFNHYGKSKWEAEEILRSWFQKNHDASLTILRPTVIFGERNRGNVYNLLKQIASGRFLMVGNGHNIKSMSYVGNIAAFLEFLIQKDVKGYNVYNYSDKPDFSTHNLVENVETILNKKLSPITIPYFIGLMGGYCFDVLAFITRKKLSISSIRIKKFCATTQFSSKNISTTGFVAPFPIQEGLQKTITNEFGKK